MDLGLITPDMCCVVIGVGATAGRGLSGTANLGDYGADDPWRSQEPPALSAQRSKQLFLTYKHTHTPSLSYRIILPPPFFSLSHTPTYTFPHTASVPHLVILNYNQSPVFFRALLHSLSSSPELHEPGPTPAQKDDPDGRGNCRRHVVPKCQQICPQRSGCQELHGSGGLHCEDWR